MDLIPRNYLNDLFDDFMPSKEDNMKCDIYEKDGKYHIEMDVPGYDKKDIKIEAKKDYLTVTAEKENDEEEKTKKYYHRERSYGKYQRSFYLGDLDSNKIDAEFKNGMLKITIPKKQEEQENKKYIEIK